MPISLIYSPFPSLESARFASHALLGQKLVACCNLLPAGESHYLWKGELTTASEVVLIAKTTAPKLEKAKEALARHHPYECPSILSFEADATPEFAAWVATSTS